MKKVEVLYPLKLPTNLPICCFFFKCHAVVGCFVWFFVKGFLLNLNGLGYMFLGFLLNIWVFCLVFVKGFLLKSKCHDTDVNYTWILKKCVKFVPDFTRKNLPKGRHFTCLEDPGINIVIMTRIFHDIRRTNTISVCPTNLQACASDMLDLPCTQDAIVANEGTKNVSCHPGGDEESASWGQGRVTQLIW